MPILKLSFENSVLRELPISTDPVSIGRSPQSDIFIDNPAVSFHHAKVFNQGGLYYVQDLASLNGTFLNGVRISQAPLSHGDTITVGKHTVRFSMDRPGETPQVVPSHPGPEAPDSVPKLEGTMILDTKMRRELQERLAKGQAASTAPAGRVGKLTVLKGRTVEKELLLTSQTSMVGKSEGCALRLKGWFAPKIGAILTKHGEAYFVSPSAKEVSINGQPLTAKTELKDGDRVTVGKVEMQFTLVAW
ncbi:MAG: FHA domain-containing protein [Acidobacteriia bacterium]|nr:FHA domain-containing protein [Terriglobia bacterium]